MLEGHDRLLLPKAKKQALTCFILNAIALSGKNVAERVNQSFCLSLASRTIPIGTAYPVWTGIGAVGTVLIGIFVFNEAAGFWRLFFISTLIISIVGLKILS